MLDYDLAILYEVETKRLKESVRRNLNRFPGDFMFELTRNEYNLLRTQFATLENGKGKHSKFNSFAFTEQGVAMLSSVLNSEKAVDVSITVMRAFVELRKFSMTYGELAEKIAHLETATKKQFKDIYEVLNLLVSENEDSLEWKDRDRIGYTQTKK